jgi:aminoacrylate hydrolase
MARDVLDIMDQAGVDRCHVIGHALGGLIGLDLALSAPERLHSLVLVNAWARISAPTRRCFEARRTLLQLAGPKAYVRAQAIFLYPAPWLARNAAAVAREEEHALAHFQGTDTLLARIAAIETFDVQARLAAIATPTLALTSRDDVLVPYTCSEDLAAAIPGCRLALLPEGGHSCCVTDPAAFNTAVLAFLDGLAPR